jgi:hypothetical protein
MTHKSNRRILWGARIALLLLLLCMFIQWFSMYRSYTTLASPFVPNIETLAISNYYLLNILSLIIWNAVAAILYFYKKYWLVILTPLVVFVVNPFVVYWFLV